MVTYDKDTQGLLRVSKETLKDLKKMRKQSKDDGDVETMGDVVARLVQFYKDKTKIT